MYCTSYQEYNIFSACTVQHIENMILLLMITVMSVILLLPRADHISKY